MTHVSIVTIAAGRRNHLVRLLEGLARSVRGAQCLVVEMSTGEQPLCGVAMPVPIEIVTLARDDLPLAEARNCGRAAARGDTLVFLDVDCIPGRKAVQALVEATSYYDALICAKVRYLRDAVADAWVEEDLLAASDDHPARTFPAIGLVEAEHPGLFWSLAFAVRATTFDKIGCFDQNFRGYGAEDTDFAFRARDVGVPTLLCADAVVFHQPHATFDPPVQHFVDIMRNATLFRDRHGVWPMQEWLDGFVRLGLAERAGGAYYIVRMPTPQDLIACRKT